MLLELSIRNFAIVDQVTLRWAPGLNVLTGETGAGKSILIDAVSARYLQGTNIDYVLGMAGAGFKFNNPNASGTCGCGSSFAV